MEETIPGKRLKSNFRRQRADSTVQVPAQVHSGAAEQRQVFKITLSSLVFLQLASVLNFLLLKSLIWNIPYKMPQHGRKQYGNSSKA